MENREQKRLDALIGRYQQKADKAYDLYQQTGATRYDTERRNCEEIAEYLRQAYNAQDEHLLLGSLRAEVNMLASNAERGTDPEKIVSSLISIAVTYCKYRRQT